MKLHDLSTMSVACYARFSTDRQDARSIDDQLRRCRDYAQNHGHAIVLEERDAAISGAHIDRDGLQRLLALSNRRPTIFQAVLVDDLSRLSRDLGATWRIVFEDLAAAGIKVIDCALGIASDDPNARLVFGATALVNDTFLQIVRHETHRGLQGRALAGFSTGGRTYGYMTIEEENAPDPEHKRRRPVIHEEEAALVRRVFDLFLSGWSLKKIASQLNHEGVTAPHDAGRGNKIGHGWGHSTVRAMLKNERYTGRWTWNQSKWVRVPGKRGRRRLARPEHEAVVREEPSLVIVPIETWNAVQERFTKRYKPHGGRRGRPPGTGQTPYLISGLLRCGVCGGSMTVVGARVKAGVRYTTFGCTAHYSRGDAVCANNRTISERKVTTAIVDSLKEILTGPEFLDRFTQTFERRVRELQRPEPDSLDLERKVREAETRIRNVTEALAKLGYSDALAEQLQVEEARLGALKENRAAKKKVSSAALPERHVIAGYFSDLQRVLETDKVRGREVLGRHLRPIVLTPEAEGPVRGYRATGAFNFGSFLAESSGKSSSGGRI